MLRGQLRVDGPAVGCHQNLLGTHIRRCLAQSTLALPAALEQLGICCTPAGLHGHVKAWACRPLPEVHEKVALDAKDMQWGAGSLLDATL